ncbi:putative nicotinamide riboside protein [Chaetomium sp. MPI-CAGE-AT-0009]|nr:putative nicotinamide riboside protein [Chaetomium sp. MPI-CAGE-AT-0009]
MARTYFSPYAPRRRRSPQVVLVWVSMFVFILWVTWYITTRHKEEASPYVNEFMHPGRMVREEYAPSILATMDQTRTIIIGISGCSSSGKTTLARLLRDMFPETFILHEDDFYKPESELPINQGHADWDCPEAISIPDLEAALAHVRATGTFPVSSCVPTTTRPNTLSRRSNHGCAPLTSPAPLSPPLPPLSPPPLSSTTPPSSDPLTKRPPACPPQPNVNSIEDLNTVGPCPATPEQIAACAARVHAWLAPGQPGSSIFGPATATPNSSHPNPNTTPNPQEPQPQTKPKPKTRLCILDGFLLYSPPHPHPPPPQPPPSALFLLASRANALRRRTARDGYVHMDGFWTDPPGYVEQVVWPNYVAVHRWLFEGGDVEGGKLDGAALGREGILAPPGTAAAAAGEGEGGDDVEFGVVLEWAVGAVMGELERLCLGEGKRE